MLTKTNLVLSNTRVANLFNLPAITIPIKKNHWLSFSILGKQGNDEGLLSLAVEIEKIISRKGSNDIFK